MIYDELKDENGIVDLGPNACKIFGVTDIPNGGKDYVRCVILEYIDGKTLYDYIQIHEYGPYEVAKWLKDICKSLKIMYGKNLLHGSIGTSNVMIRKSNGSAVLVDYERVMYKDIFEFFYKSADALPDCNKAGMYYDLDFINAFIRDLIDGKKYISSRNPELHKKLSQLHNSTCSLEELLDKIDTLNIN